MPPNTVSVTRPGKFGNPYKIGGFVRIHPDALPLPIVSAEQAVKLFRADAMHPQAGLIFRENVRRELAGKDLACFCAEDAEWCHADVLLEIANG